MQHLEHSVALLIFISIFGKSSMAPQRSSSVHVSHSSPHHQYSYGFGDGTLPSTSGHQGLDESIFGHAFPPSSASLHQSHGLPHATQGDPFTIDLSGIHHGASSFDDFSHINSPSLSSSSSSSFSSNLGSSFFTNHGGVEQFNELPLEQFLLQHHQQPIQFTSGFPGNSIDLQATHSKIDFTQQLLNPIGPPEDNDPYLVTGAEAKQKVNHLFMKRLFWKDIKHENMLLRNQQERRENGLSDMVLGSNRPSSPFYHGNKFRQHPTEG